MLRIYPNQKNEQELLDDPNIDVHKRKKLFLELDQSN